MKKRVIFLVLLFIYLPVTSSNLYFRHLGLKEGLSQINVLAIYQDEIGAMWFGSSEGLNRYNGTTIEVFRPTQHSQGLTQNVIYGLTGNRKGALYIRTSNDLIRYDLYRNEFDRIRQGDVNAMCFHQDTLWVSTRDSLFYFLDSDRELHPYHAFSSVELSVLALHAVGDELWVSTGEEVIAVSRKQEAGSRFLFSISGAQCFYTDRSGQIWIGTRDDGLYMIRDGVINRHFTAEDKSNSLTSNQVRSVIEGERGNIWIGTFSGLIHYNPQTEEWKTYIPQEDIPYSLSHSSIYALYNDDQNTIWIGTYFGGINYFYPQSDICQIYTASSFNEAFLSFSFVGKMTEDQNEKLWICTEGGGLNCFDPVYRTFRWYKYTPGHNNPISHNNLKSIWYRQEKHLIYIGTYNGGLVVFNPESGTSYTLMHDLADPYSLPDNVVNEMQYYKGDLVILTQDGLSRMDLREEKFYPFTEDEELRALLMERFCYETFLIDSNNRLWLAHTDGGLTCVDLDTHTRQRYMYDPDQEGTIGQFKIVTICEDSRKQVYFGTLGSGLYKYLPEEDRFLSYRQEERELLSNYCYYVRETNSHQLLVLHNEGISLLDPEMSILNFTYNFYKMRFNQGSAIYQNRKGEIFLGGIDGMLSFREEQLIHVNRGYDLYFDKLYVNNHPVLPGDDSGILKEILPRTSQLKLNYKQNNLTFQFCTSNYSVDSNNLYEYKLDNFDTHWIPVSASNIVYTNLSSGKYVLRLRELGGVREPDHEISLDIQISPPFYFSSYAYAIYVLLAGALFGFIVRFKTKQAELRASLAYERKEKLRIEELNQIKLSFFTNISHEFRTPLTLIIGQIEHLLQLNRLEPAVYNRILRIYRNSWHLRDLITELLDFRKQEQGFLKLHVESRDLVAYAKEVYMSFYEYAMSRHINYRFEHVEDKIIAWFDPVQMKKVIFNLLSNAFKYTPENGTIVVTVRRSLQEIQILVKDTGVGISPESLDKIFDRFYQSGKASSEFTAGTGIGLALSKGIVELHKGHIKVDSQLGEGCLFTVSLPVGYSHFTDNEIEEGDKGTEMILADPVSHDLPVPVEEESLQPDTEEGLYKPTILIVEDNKDLLEMLVDIFKPLYNVHTATDGIEGLSLVQQIQPDIVLGDVMMPNMSGKEMCYRIKNSVELSHIPVVLITAQTSVEYAIEGYMYGADDYITKPFHVKLLISRCNNLIKGRKILMERFSRKQEQIITADAVTEQDKAFIERTMEIIRQNFDNPTFDMNMLASELNLGRSKLYIKLKEVTGFTPNEFTLKLKLDEAMNLLLNHPEFNITEIAYRLGFSSARYFSKCFKDLYGKSPQEVKRKSNKLGE